MNKTFLYATWSNFLMVCKSFIVSSKSKIGGEGILLITQ